MDRKSFAISELGKVRNAKSKITEVQNPWAFHCLVESSCLQGTDAFAMAMCTYVHLSVEEKLIFTETGLNIWRKPTLFFL